MVSRKAKEEKERREKEMLNRELRRGHLPESVASVRPVCPLGSCVDGLVAFQAWKKLDGAAGFLLGEAQVVERL